MEFQSFEEALAVCANAKEGSEEQEAAMLYCLEHAPADLREMIKKQFLAAKAGRTTDAGCDHEHHGNCGCGHD
ncbi:MAG: hypothetical protein OEV91_05845 [Desulfobulbaceae bacterium]|nr:hypothetical protein [Desulfobulbaceae bacterium]